MILTQSKRCNGTFRGKVDMYGVVNFVPVHTIVLQLKEKMSFKSITTVICSVLNLLYEGANHRLEAGTCDGKRRGLTKHFFRAAYMFFQGSIMFFQGSILLYLDIHIHLAGGPP